MQKILPPLQLLTSNLLFFQIQATIMPLDYRYKVSASSFLF